MDRSAEAARTSSSHLPDPLCQRQLLKHPRLLVGGSGEDKQELRRKVANRIFDVAPEILTAQQLGQITPGRIPRPCKTQRQQTGDFVGALTFSRPPNNFFMLNTPYGPNRPAKPTSPPHFWSDR